MEEPEVKEDLLTLTQNIRRDIMTGLVGVDPVSSPEMVELLLRTMKDADQTELSSRRLGIDSSLAAENIKTNKLLADLFGKVTSDPFTSDGGGSVIKPDIPAPTAVEGEMDLGINNESYESFYGEEDK